MNAPQKHRRKFRHVHRPPQPLSAKICQHSIFALGLLILATTPFWCAGQNTWVLGLVQAAVWLGGLLWLVRIVTRREIEWAAPTVVIPILVVLGYVLIRYAFAPVESVSRREVLLLTSAVLCFLMLHCNMSHRWQTTALLWIWVGLAVALALDGIGQAVLGGRLGWGGMLTGWKQTRATGPFLVPSHYAGYLTMVFAVAAANAFFSRRTYVQKVGLLIGCVLLALAGIFSLAYEAWWGLIAVTAVVGIYVIQRRGYRFRWVLVGATILLSVILAVIIAWEGSPSTPDVTSESLPYLALWRSALGMSLGNLAFGNGPGMFPWLFAAHRTLGGQPANAHNELFNVLADYGLVGVLLFIWVVVSFIWTTTRIIAARAARYSQEAQSNRYAFAIAGLAAFMAMLVQSLVDGQLRTPANLFTLAAIMAVTLTCGVRSASAAGLPIDPFNDEALAQLRGPAKVAVVAALIVTLGFLGLWLPETIPAAYFLGRAQHEQAELHWSAAEIQYLHAWQFNPQSYQTAAAYGDFFAARATWNVPERPLLTKHALRWYETARGLNPYACDLLVKMARLQDALGKQQAALATYQQALQADPDNAAYYVQLGLHHQRWHEPDAAYTAFQRARELGDISPITDLQLRRLDSEETPDNPSTEP